MAQEKLPITKKDILKKAQQIIRNDSLDEDSCSPYCPWCAISKAKTEFDEKYNIGPPLAECFRQVMLNDYVELPEDAPLVEAREALKPFSDMYGKSITQKKSLEMLQQAEISEYIN